LSADRPGKGKGRAQKDQHSRQWFLLFHTLLSIGDAARGSLATPTIFRCKMQMALPSQCILQRFLKSHQAHLPCGYWQDYALGRAGTLHFSRSQLTVLEVFYPLLLTPGAVSFQRQAET
jgi:hypothetical protein